MSLTLLFAWLMVVLRSIGIVLQLPVLAGQPIPVMVRMGLSVGIATLMAGLVPVVPPPPDLWTFIAVGVMEVVVGLTLGFIVRVTFAAVEMAGRLISTEIGLTAMPGLGAPVPSQEPVAALLTALASVLFFLLGAHQGVLTALARSFQIAPAGGGGFDPTAGMSVIRSVSHMIEVGFRIAAPFIAMNFLVNLAFSVLGKAVPKMNVFIVSFSARALFGLALLATSGGLVARYMYVEFGDLPLRMLRLLQAG